jgi:hypothetical protein
VLGQATGNTDSLDSPRPRLGGSHPPHIIFSAFAHGTYIRMAFLSRESQGGFPKLSWFGLSRLWKVITPRSDLWLGWGLKQNCSSPQELSNGVLHFTCTHRDRVDHRLLVVGSQIVSLTPGPSFDHNLCCRCPNGSCEVIFDIYTSRPFQKYKEHLNAKCFDPCNQALSFRKSQRTPSSHFWECEFHPHTCLKVGLQQCPYRGYWALEYATLGQLNDKVDVYSFGILWLEIGKTLISHCQ